ncbi:MAG: hypothetical protein PHC88_10625 [Terrimicrobiaceae bacterium]|nr:hypothetical protein [Terrimicrobiaceae bacterium]
MTPAAMLQPVDRKALRSARLKKLAWTVVILVVLLHVGAGLVAGALVVARYFMKPEATFQASKDLRMPAKERENRMNMAEFDALAPKPSFNDKLQALKPTAFSLPELPKIPMDQMLPLDPSAIVSDQVSSMVGAAAVGSGIGQGGSGGGGTGTGFSFLGIQTTAKRILILYDVSASVVTAANRAGYSMEKIRDETKTMLAGLGVNTRFDLGQFARNYAFFSPEMLPASDPNRQSANAWFDEWFATDGAMKQSTPNMARGSPGFIEVLHAAFKLNPDVIFVISDASFERGSGSSGAQIPFPELDDALRDLQKASPTPVQIHFVGVGMKPANEKEMRRVMAKHSAGGRFRQLK